MSSKKNLLQLEGAKLNENKNFEFNVDNINIEKDNTQKSKIFWIDKYSPTKTSDINSNKDEILYNSPFITFDHIGVSYLATS